MFIWTLHDVIGLGMLGLMVLVAITYVACCYANRAFNAVKRWLRR